MVIHMCRGRSREALQGWRHLDAARRLGSALASTQVHPTCNLFCFLHYIIAAAMKPHHFVGTCAVEL